MINGNPKKRPCSRNVILRGIFTKVLKGSKCFLACLDLVNKEQGFIGHDTLPRASLNRTHNRMRIETARKVSPSRSVILEIDIDDRLEKIPCICSEQIGLAALAYALDQQRLPIDFVSPFLKEPVCFPAHERPFLINYCLAIF